MPRVRHCPTPPRLVTCREALDLQKEFRERLQEISLAHYGEPAELREDADAECNAWEHAVSVLRGAIHSAHMTARADTLRMCARRATYHGARRVYLEAAARIAESAATCQAA